MTHAMTGPIASRRSDLHGAETQTLNATLTTVKATAITKRTVGRPPPNGRARRVSAPSRTCSAAIPCAITEESQATLPGHRRARPEEGGCCPERHLQRAAVARTPAHDCERVSQSARQRKCRANIPVTGIDPDVPVRRQPRRRDRAGAGRSRRQARPRHGRRRPHPPGARGRARHQADVGSSTRRPPVELRHVHRLRREEVLRARVDDPVCGGAAAPRRHHREDHVLEPLGPVRVGRADDLHARGERVAHVLAA